MFGFGHSLSELLEKEVASYRVYDENDKESLYLDFFDGLKVMMIDQLDEYTIAL